ncbi:MAG: hypothetical protein RBU37_07635 [Myxococcota bacterium]|nr:hypothetical protein [Myxococcota bacterium]
MLELQLGETSQAPNGQEVGGTIDQVPNRQGPCFIKLVHPRHCLRGS